VVWTRKHIASDGLQEDGDPVPAHLAIEHAAFRALEIKLETEAVDVVSD
jgi:hypothetical protein